LRSLYELRHPATAVEVAARVTDDYASRESIRKRSAELLAAGKIVEVGKRRCNITGQMARTFLPAQAEPVKTVQFDFFDEFSFRG
jgi:hypothetical protein